MPHPVWDIAVGKVGARKVSHRRVEAACTQVSFPLIGSYFPIRRLPALPVYAASACICIRSFSGNSWSAVHGFAAIARPRDPGEPETDAPSPGPRSTAEIAKLFTYRCGPSTADESITRTRLRDASFTAILRDNVGVCREMGYKMSNLEKERKLKMWIDTPRVCGNIYL